MKIQRNPESWSAKKRNWAKKQRKKASAIDREFEARILSLYDEHNDREEIVHILTKDWKGSIPKSLYRTVDRILRNSGRN